MGSTKIFQIWYHSVHNYRNYRQKTAIRQLSPKYSGPRAQKLWVRSENFRGAKMGLRSSTRVQSLVDIGVGYTRWQEMKNNVFVSMCVCHVGCQGKMSGRSTTYNVTVCRSLFQCGFHCFVTEKNGLSNCVQRFQLHHWLAPQFSTESVKKIFKLKTDRKVCAHDFDHLGGAYNYRASICEGGLGSRNSVRLPVCPSSVCHTRGLWQN